MAGASIKRRQNSSTSSAFAQLLAEVEDDVELADPVAALAELMIDAVAAFKGGVQPLDRIVEHGVQNSAWPAWWQAKQRAAPALINPRVRPRSTRGSDDALIQPRLPLSPPGVDGKGQEDRKDDDYRLREQSLS